MAGNNYTTLLGTLGSDKSSAKKPAASSKPGEEKLSQNGKKPTHEGHDPERWLKPEEEPKQTLWDTISNGLWGKAPPPTGVSKEKGQPLMWQTSQPPQGTAQRATPR